MGQLIEKIQCPEFFYRRSTTYMLFGRGQDSKCSRRVRIISAEGLSIQYGLCVLGECIHGLGDRGFWVG